MTNRCYLSSIKHQNNGIQGKFLSIFYLLGNCYKMGQVGRCLVAPTPHRFVRAQLTHTALHRKIAELSAIYAAS